MVLPEPSAAFVVATAVHCAAPLGYDEVSTARLLCDAVVVTCAPPPSRTFPAGQFTVTVTRVLFGRPAADVVALVTI